ncbi:MAG: PKD domain-containing protein, partial [Bacteroidota bacterium]
DEYGCGAFRFSVTVDPSKTVASYSWFFDDGNVSNAASPIHAFTLGSNRFVTVTVNYDDGTSCNGSTIVEVDCQRCGIPLPYNPEWNYYLPDGCSTNAYISLTPNNNNIASVTWDFGDGNPPLVLTAAASAFFQYDFLVANTYIVTVTVKYNDDSEWTCSRFVSVSDCSDNCVPELCPNLTEYGGPFYGVEDECPIDFGFLYCPGGIPVDCSKDCTGPSQVFLYYFNPDKEREVVAGEEFIITWIEQDSDCVPTNEGNVFQNISQDDIDNNVQYTVTIQSSDPNDTWQCVLCFSAGDLCGGEGRVGGTSPVFFDQQQFVNQAKADQLEVFPNPVNDQLSISNKNKQMVMGQLVTLDGKVMTQVQLSEYDQKELNVKAYNAGIYFFHFYDLNTNELVKSEKIVIRH